MDILYKSSAPAASKGGRVQPTVVVHVVLVWSAMGMDKYSACWGYLLDMNRGEDGLNPQDN